VTRKACILTKVFYDFTSGKCWGTVMCYFWPGGFDVCIFCVFPSATLLLICQLLVMQLLCMYVFIRPSSLFKCSLYDNHCGDVGVDGWIILGCISRRWDVGIWTGLDWPRIETGGECL